MSLNQCPKYMRIIDFLKNNGAFYSDELRKLLNVTEDDLIKSRMHGVMTVPYRKYGKNRSVGSTTSDYFNRLTKHWLYFTGSGLFDAIRRVEEDMVLKPEDVHSRFTKCILKNLIENKIAIPISAYLLDKCGIGVNQSPHKRRTRSIPPFYTFLQGEWGFLAAKHLARKIDLSRMDTILVPESGAVQIGHGIERLTKRPVVTMRENPIGIKRPVEIKICNSSGHTRKKLYLEENDIQERIRGRDALVFDDYSNTYSTLGKIKEVVYKNEGNVETAVLLANENVAEAHEELLSLVTLPSLQMF